MQLTFTSSSFYALPVPFLFFLLQSHLITAAVVSFESPLDTRTVQDARREFRYACKEAYINNACVLHKKTHPRTAYSIVYHCSISFMYLQISTCCECIIIGSRHSHPSPVPNHQIMEPCLNACLHCWPHALMAALHTTIDPCRRVCDILGQTAVASTVVFNNFKCKGLQHLKKNTSSLLRYLYGYWKNPCHVSIFKFYFVFIK